MKKVKRVRKTSFRLFNLGDRIIELDYKYIILTIIYILAFIVFDLIYKHDHNTFLIKLIIINPSLTLIASIILSKNKFNIIVGLIPAIIFLIFSITYLRYPDWFLSSAYGLIAIFGNYIGYIIKTKLLKKDNNNNY